MKVVDSREHGGVGILPLQDHSARTEIDMRHMVVALRKVGRLDAGGQLGHLIHQPGSPGDVIGGFIWPQQVGKRPMPAWSFVFPSVTSYPILASGTPDASAGGNASGGGAVDAARGNVDPDKPGGGDAPASPPPPKGGVAGGGGGNAIGSIGEQNNGMVPRYAGQNGQQGQGPGLLYTNIHQGSFGGFISTPTFYTHNEEGRPVPSLFGIFPDFPGITHHDYTAAELERLGVDVAAYIHGATESKNPPNVLPTQGEAWTGDVRFSTVRMRQPGGWPEMPIDWHGVTVAGTNEDRQVEYFHPTDPRLPLVHFAGRPVCGAVACDLEDDSRPDPERHARLHSMMRIVKHPPRALNRNVVAWNLTVNGKSDGHGGYVVDRAEDKGGRRTISGGDRSPRNRGGTTPRFAPTGAVPPGLRPALNRGGGGAGAAGVPRADPVVVAMASHNDKGPFHPGSPRDMHSWGKDEDGNTVNPLHLQTQALWYNPRRPYEDGPMLFEPKYEEGEDYEYITKVHLAFDFRSGFFRWWSTTSEYSYSPPAPEPEPPEEPPHEPRDPRRPTTPTDDPSPEPYTGGGDPTGPGVPLKPPDNPAPPSPPPPPPPGPTPPPAPFPPVPEIQGGASPPRSRTPHTGRWLERIDAAVAFHAPQWGPGLPNLVRAKRTLPRETSPVVVRMETFARQTRLGGAFEYTQRPGESRYDATATGGVWYLPPEVSAEDYGTDFEPGDRDISSSVVGFGPGTRAAFGVPDLLTGGVRDGWSVRGNSTQLLFALHNSAGAGTDRYAMRVDGLVHPFGSLVTTTGSQGDNPIAYGVTRITTAPASAVATLPAPVAGLTLLVINDGANTVSVYPESGGDIDGNGVDTPESVAAGARLRFTGISATEWVTE